MEFLGKIFLSRLREMFFRDIEHGSSSIIKGGLQGECFCFLRQTKSVTKIVENGGEWYKQFGTSKSTGSKLLSISGDCEKPGIYEIEFGVTVRDFLSMVGAEDAYAVQVSGPSGE